MSIQFKDNGGSLVMRSPTLAEADFTPVVDPTTTVLTGSMATQTTIDDTVFDVMTSADTVTDGTVRIQSNNAPAYTPTFSIHPADTAIASVDAHTGVVTRIIDGTARVNCSTPLIIKQIDVTCSHASSVTTNSFNHYVSGSLAEHCAANIDALAVSGKSIDIFSTVNYATPNFVRNTNCWASSIDLCAIAAATASPVGVPIARRGATLITPRHILMATHAPYSLGSTIWFVDSSNNLITKTLVSVTSYLSTWSFADVCIGTLDSDVAGITPLLTMPHPFTLYFGMNDSWYAANTSPGVPGIFTCFVHGGNGKQAGIFELGTAQAVSYNDQAHTSLNSVGDGGGTPSTVARQQYSIPLITGDSGNPMGLLITPPGAATPVFVVLGPFWAQYACTDLASCVSAINTDIAGTGHQVGTIDLSAFPTY